MKAAVPAVRQITQRTRRHVRWPKLLSGILLTMVVGVYMLPLLYMLLTSLRSGLDIAMRPLGLPTGLHLENYTDVAGRMNYGRALFNTVLITVCSVSLVILLASLAAFPLARWTSRLSTALYLYFVAGLVIPGFALLVPLYSLMKGLGLVNTYLGLVLLYTAGNLPFSVFFFTSFIRGIPRELEEAAAMDGSSPVHTFFRIILPLLKPVTATVAMFVTLGVWNDFLYPFVFLFKPESRTLMASVYNFLGFKSYDPVTLFPATVLASIPLLIFFLILQRQIIAGFISGAIKG